MSSALAAASLILKPEGYSEGRLQTLKPIEKLGSELVTNGDFVNGSSNWSTYTSGSSNVVFSDDVATINIDGSNSNVGIYQENVFSSGVQYKIVLRAKSTSSFDAEVVESQAAATQQVISSFSLTTSYQDFVFTHTANGTNDIFIHRLFSASGANESIIIDNVSVKEVLVDGGDFTFTRGSNLSATRVNSAGLIEKGRENLLLQSNQFDTTPWVASNVILTSGQLGYDGSNNAWLVAKNGSGFRSVYQYSNELGVATLTVYAKEGTTNWMRLTHGGKTAYFDLSGSGSIGASSNAIDQTITSVGNGWFKCTLTANRTVAGQVPIYPYTAEGDASGSTDSIYIQNVQLEAGMVATDYIETGASTVKAGILENTPRLDYSGGATEPSLLLEPSRTQLVTQSEYFGGYSNSNSTDEPNATTSPEGLTNATSFLEAATTGQHKLTTSLSFDGSSTYTFSIFAKTNGRDLYIDTQNSNEWGGRAWFDLTNGTANSVLGTANIEDFGNGWYRCIVTGESTLAGGNLVELLTSDGSTNSTTGDITKGVFIYGAQMEQGSYATSYIPTYGSSETRAADGCDKDGFVSSGITTSSNFTFYMELEGLGQNNNPQVYLEDVSGNRILSLNLVGQKNRYGFYSPDASNYVSPSSNEADGIVKIAVTYDGTDFKEYFNGVEKGTRAASVTVGIDGINFNEIPSNSIAVHKAILFPTALSDAECITLTTL